MGVPRSARLHVNGNSQVRIYIFQFFLDIVAVSMSIANRFIFRQLNMNIHEFVIACHTGPEVVEVYVHFAEAFFEVPDFTFRP